MSVVDVHGLAKRFGAHVAAKDISLQVSRGQVIGFLGPNGCGKTTTFRMLCGLIRPDTGTGTCAGYDILTESSSVRSRIGYMTQRFGLYDDLTVEENLSFFARLSGMPDRNRRVAEVEERFGLRDRSGQQAGTLSGGWKQRLSLAASILHNPVLLLLDEPTAGVDPEARRDFWSEIHRLAREGITVLVSTHYLDEATLCDEIRFLLEGEIIAAGASRDIVEQAGLRVLTMDTKFIGDFREYSRNLPSSTRYSVTGKSLRVILSGNESGIEQAETRLLQDFGASPAEVMLDDVFVQLAGNNRKQAL